MNEKEILDILCNLQRKQTELQSLLNELVDELERRIEKAEQDINCIESIVY